MINKKNKTKKENYNTPIVWADIEQDINYQQFINEISSIEQVMSELNTEKQED